MAICHNNPGKLPPRRRKIWTYCCWVCWALRAVQQTPPNLLVYTPNVYDLAFSVGQEFGNSLAGCVRPGSPVGVRSRCWARCKCLEGWTRTLSTFRMLRRREFRLYVLKQCVLEGWWMFFKTIVLGNCGCSCAGAQGTFGSMGPRGWAVLGCRL